MILLAGFDYIVVGGGSAGCVLAARLSEDPGTRVLLLEAGDDERKFFRIAMPLAWRDAFRDPRLSWGYETEPEPFADGRKVPAPRGKVLGGSNSVNGLMYMRGCPADYDDWAKAGASGWDYESVLPYFRRSECNWRGASRFHKSNGARAGMYSSELYSSLPSTRLWLQVSGSSKSCETCL